MSAGKGSVSSSGVSDEEYERATELLYETLKDNVQQIANKMKNCSEILQDLAKDMDSVSTGMAAVQKHSLLTKNATSQEERMSQDK